MLALLTIVIVGVYVHLITHPIMDALATVFVLVSLVVSTIAVICGLIFIIPGYIAFSANVIQYGLDQLHDAPTDDLVLYVHWFVWTTYLAALLTNMSFLMASYFFSQSDNFFSLYISLCFLLVVMTCALGITLGVEHYKRHWFLIDSGSSRNPYKLVYKVLKTTFIQFVVVPSPTVRMSFPPSRLDLGNGEIWRTLHN